MALPPDVLRALNGPNAPVKGGLVLWLSGADKTILAKCPSERGKFIGVGGVILTTATMAAVSATFALIIGARANPIVAVLVGLFWGLAIMNLDRWLVSATARRERWYQNLVIALPRMLLALVIGLVISTPLVLWIFQREIEAHLNVMIAQKSTDFQEQLNGNPRLAQIKPLQERVTQLQGMINGTLPLTANTDLDRLRTQRDNAKAAYDKAVADALAEWEGRGPSGRFGDGPIWREKKAIENQAKGAYERAEGAYQTAFTAAQGNFQKELTDKQAELKVYTDERDAQIAAFEADNKDDRGLLARLNALTSLTDSNGTLKGAYLALLAFITVIEILPVLVKYLMSLGEPSLYDLVLAASTTTRTDIAKEELKYERETAVRKLDLRRVREAEIDAAEIDEQLDAQKAVRGKAIEEWKNTQLGLPPTQPRRSPLSGVWPRRKSKRGNGVDDQGYTLWPDPE